MVVTEEPPLDDDVDVDGVLTIGQLSGGEWIRSSTVPPRAPHAATSSTTSDAAFWSQRIGSLWAPPSGVLATVVGGVVLTTVVGGVVLTTVGGGVFLTTVVGVVLPSRVVVGVVGVATSTGACARDSVLGVVAAAVAGERTRVGLATGNAGGGAAGRVFRRFVSE